MSRYFSPRIDLFIILSVLILMLSHIITNFIILNMSGSDHDIKSKKTEIFLSARSEELFGRELTEALLLEFEGKNPDLKLVILNGSDKREPAPSPDILFFDEGEISELAASGALLSLESYFNQERNPGNFAANIRFDNPRDVRKTGMDLFTVPLVSFIDLLFYNIELITAAGFDRPPKTREEFLRFAKAVSAGSASGAALGLSSQDRQAVSRDIFSWIWASGGDFWAIDNSHGGQKPVINTRAMIRDIAFLGSLNGEGALAPVSFGVTGGQRLEEFAQGKIALLIASSRAIPRLREKMGDNVFGITTIPDSGYGGKYNLGLCGLYAGISADCEYPDEAWNFLSFLAEQIPHLCAQLYAVPGIVSGFFSGDFNYMQDDPFYSKARDIFESSEIVYGFSKTAGAADYEKIVLEEIREYFDRNLTAEQTAAAIQRRWDDVPVRNR